MRYSMAVLKVEDVAKWKENYHGQESQTARRAAGEKSWKLFHATNEANVLVLLNEWADEAKAMAFFQSGTLRRFQETSGVVGTPQILLFDDVQQGTI
jgi:quinol monooxygenase YgiN